jgi:hypothetical protein
VTLCSAEEGRSCVWGLRGRRNQRGKGWNRGEGSVGAVVGCLWGGAVAEMEKMEGLSLVAGLERKKKLERWG